MSKPIEGWQNTYTAPELAAKYGLTVEQARVVISSNGPSRHGCEIGATAFRNALKMRAGGLHERLLARECTPIADKATSLR
ncbi:MAG: hypothetical protein EOR60_26605 [Mesorhizobium sp.]|nr:MAG: hypothetical protein EOR60_26605 [Mesorhizobium sp.]